MPHQSFKEDIWWIGSINVEYSLCEHNDDPATSDEGQRSNNSRRTTYVVIIITNYQREREGISLRTILDRLATLSHSCPVSYLLLGNRLEIISNLKLDFQTNRNHATAFVSPEGSTLIN